MREYSENFKGLAMLIPISNDKLIDDILMPQILALESIDEKRELMQMILDKE